MRLGRWAMVVAGAGLLAGAACSSEGDDDDSTATGTTTGTGTMTGTGTGTGAGTNTGAGTPTGTAAGTVSGTPTGMAGSCDSGAGLSPEERFRGTCTLMVQHPDWGQCANDPASSAAIDLCETQQICSGCDYLWWPDATYGNYANCLDETADLRCCLLGESGPFQCSDPDGLTVFAENGPQCQAAYDAFATCMQ